MIEKLYRSHSLDVYKDGENVITSGSLTIWEDAPVSPFNIGDTFKPISSSPNLTVEKINIQDNVVGELYGKPVRQWQITIEGSNEVQSSSQQNTHVLYNFNISADENSGTMEVTNTGDAPIITINIGDKFNVPGIGEIPCVGVKGSDSYDDNGVHTWTITYEASDAEDETQPNKGTKYSFSVENNSDGVATYSGSKEFTAKGESPEIDIKVGDKFSLPLVGELTCTKVNGNNDGSNKWTVNIEGTRSGSSNGNDGEETTLPESEIVTSYEINGTTVRSVSGEFIALRCSNTPITKKSITVYSNSSDAIASPGTSYEGGIVISESISKETVKVNNVVTGSYYKHQIEVEA